MNEKSEKTASQEEKTEDIAMIDLRVKNLARQILEEKEDRYKDINELIEQAFTLGVRELLASGEKPRNIEDKYLVEDDFKYPLWQLNLHPKKNQDGDWINIKTDVLNRGLKQINRE